MYRASQHAEHEVENMSADKDKDGEKGPEYRSRPGHRHAGELVDYRTDGAGGYS